MAAIPAALGVAAAAALSDPYIRGALVGTAVHGADQLTQHGIRKGLQSKHKVVRKVADKAANAYETVDSSPVAQIWKGAITGAASEHIGRKGAKFIRKNTASSTGGTTPSLKPARAIRKPKRVKRR